MLTRERTEALIVGLAVALDSAIDRGTHAPQVRRHASRFLAELQRALTENEGRAVELSMQASLFVHCGKELVRASIEGRRPIESLRACAAGGVSFQAGVDEAELLRFLDFQLGVRGQILALPDARLRLREQGVKNVRLLDSSEDYEWAPVQKKETQALFERAGFQLSVASPVVTTMALTVEEAVEQAAAGAALDMSVARTAGEQLREAGGDGFEDLMHLGERPDFDAFTVQHSMRVAMMATYVGSHMGLPTEVLIEIGAAGLMHDVGKGRIPQEILHKPGRLEDDERRVLAEHPRLGAEILLDSADVSAAALGAAWGHHLRHDGRGYPDVPIWAARSRITSLVQICDVFEALTARRPYKAPYTPARAYRILLEDVGAFDRELLAVFVRAMGLYPPGRFVVLSDGRTARVSRAGRTVDRPVVRTLPQGERIDLAEPAHAELSVVGLVDELAALKSLESPEAGEVDGFDLGTLIEDGLEAALEIEGEPDEPPNDDEPSEDGCGHDDCRLC